MSRSPRTVPTPVRLVLPAVRLLAAAAALAWVPRATLYTGTAEAAAASPVGGVVGLLADKGLLLLVAVAGVLAVRSWLRDRTAFTVLAAGGLGAVTAYATSEVVKVLVEQERPCRTFDVVTVLACPESGDWSWPSNHSTIAASLAVACLIVAPRLWPVLVPLALAIAFARVGAGVHYVHDVASGLALGTLVTAAVAQGVGAALGRRRPGAVRGRHPGPARHQVPTRHASMDRAPVTGGSADQGNVIHRSVSRHE